MQLLLHKHNFNSFTQLKVAAISGLLRKSNKGLSNDMDSVWSKNTLTAPTQVQHGKASSAQLLQTHFWH